MRSKSHLEMKRRLSRNTMIHETFKSPRIMLSCPDAFPAGRRSDGEIQTPRVGERKPVMGMTYEMVLHRLKKGIFGKKT